MLTINRIYNYSEVMFAFEPKIRYFAEVQSVGGAVFCAYYGKEPAGLVCLGRQPGIFDISYLYVKEAYRRKGIALSLMKHAAAYAEHEGKALLFRVLERSEYAHICTKIAEELHMQRFREATFFRFTVNDETRNLWQEYRPKMLELKARVEKKTGEHQIITFAEANQALLDKIKDKIGNDFPALDPFSLPEFNKEFSLIVLNNNELVAFNAVRTIGKKMIYEISSALKGMTVITGVPLFFDRLFDSDIEQVSCIVYNDNPAGLNHAKGRFGFLFKESNRQTTYIIKKLANVPITNTKEELS